MDLGDPAALPMNTPRVLRLSLVAAAVGAALSAHAVSLQLASSGAFKVDPMGRESGSETVGNQVGGYGPLSSLSLTFSASDPLPVSGSATYSGAGGTLAIRFAFSTFTSVGGFYGAYFGTWTATGGTGNYSQATGGGTLSRLEDGSDPDSYQSTTVLDGEIQAVPEPASLLALGLPALALLRRRKRS